MSVVYEVMCNIVQQRMTQMVEEKQLLAEERAGFRKERGCSDRALTLMLLEQIKAISRRGLLAAFIDVGKHTIEWIGVNCGNVWKGWHVVVESLVS